MPKAIMPESSFGGRDVSFSARRWVKMRRHFPKPLSAEADRRLCVAITECCSGFLTQQARLQRGKDIAAAMRSRGDHDLAPLEQLLKELKKAADARDKVWQILDDRLGIYENLDLMIWDLESRLTLKPVTVPDPFPVFVRKVFQCCREAGLKPTRTGRVYDERSNKPSWFQKFMATTRMCWGMKAGAND